MFQRAQHAEALRGKLSAVAEIETGEIPAQLMWQFYRDMESGEHCVEVLHDEARVFEKEEECKVVHQAD